MEREEQREQEATVMKIFCFELDCKIMAQKHACELFRKRFKFRGQSDGREQTDF